MTGPCRLNKFRILLILRFTTNLSTGIGRFPFNRTSSMVSELAPFILFLKHIVGPEDLVILEEPESHLHPAIQSQMAQGDRSIGEYWCQGDHHDTQ